MIEPHPRPAPSPPPAPGSGKLAGRLIALAGFSLLFGPCLTNQLQYWRRSGPYACGWQGKVISARPTVAAFTDLIADLLLSPSDHRHSTTSSYDSWKDGRRATGHYLAVVDDGTRPRKVAISSHQFYSLPIPSYMVCRDDQLTLFKDEAAARAAGVPEQVP